MIEQKLVLERCRTNVQGLQERIQLKFYQAIYFSERYDDRAVTVLEQISKKDVIYLRRKLNRVCPTVSLYIQALLFQHKHPQQAEQIIAKWAQLQNQSIFYRPYLQISSQYERLGEEQKSNEYCQRCLKKFQKNDNVLYLIGKAALRKGEFEQGTHLLRIGHQINSANTNILQTLAQYYEENQRWNIAERYYQQILDLQPNNQKILTRVSGLVEKAHNYKQQLHTQPKKQSVSKPMPLQVQVKRPEEPIKRQIKVIKREVIIKEEVRKIEKSSPKVSLDISPSRKITHNHPPLKVPKTNSTDTLSQAEKTAYYQLLAEAQQSPSDVDPTWKLIQYCQQTNLHESIYDHLESIIRLGKKEAHQTNRVCQKIQQMYMIHPEGHRRVAHLFSLLKQFHKNNIFVYLYEAYIAILQENRPKAIEVSSAVNMCLFVDETMLQEKQHSLFKDYAFLLGKLISCPNIDLLSLSGPYKSMIGLFQRSLHKQEIKNNGIIMQLVHLKNLLVSSKQYEIKNITLLHDTPIRFVQMYSGDIFIKDDSCLIVLDKQDLQRYLNTCDNIIIFPQQLALIGELLQNKRRKYRIFVVRIRESSEEDEVYIGRQCQKLANFRRIFIPNKPFCEIYQMLEGE